MELRDATPYALALLGIINTLLGLVYWNMRESMKELREELRNQRERFELFKDREVKALNEKLDAVRREVTEAVHRIEIALAEGYVKKNEMVALAKRVDDRIDTIAS